MCTVYCMPPAGLGVGGDEVEDEAHHHAGRHDDAGVGEDGRVDRQQTWASDMVTNMLSASLQFPMLFRENNKLSHLPSPDYPTEQWHFCKVEPWTI